MEQTVKLEIASLLGYGSADYTSITDPNLEADYVYFDSVNGAAGTDWMRGRRGYPVNNWADLVTIATARHTKNVMILNGVLTITADADQYYFTGNGFLDPTAIFADNVIELGGFTLSRCTFDSVNIHNAAGGVLDMCGSFENCPLVYATTIQGCSTFKECGTINATTMIDCHNVNICGSIQGTTIQDCDNFMLCSQIIFTNWIDCSLFSYIGYMSGTTMTRCHDITHIGTSTFTTLTNCYDISDICLFNVSGRLEFDDTVTGIFCGLYSYNNLIFDFNSDMSGMSVKIDVQCPRVYLYGTGALTHALLYGTSAVYADVSCTTGWIEIYGDQQFVDGFGGAVVSYHNTRNRPEVAVNTTATNGAETNIFNLATAGFHYMVEKLRLKCADPGANTVTVRLYELINAVSTEVDQFLIDATNFALYHSLMDMFGVDHLSGDNLKVTVRASAGGPYTVTGSYVYRSA